MADWIQDPFKSVIGGTLIVGFAVLALSMGISLLSSIV